MQRYYQPSEGKIPLNDTDIKELSLDNYCYLFSSVEQSIYLFNRTIKANILLGNEKTDTETYNKIIAECRLGEVINNVGDEDIGRDGSTLSGGQRQKISLVRAIVYDRPIIIFDEATSNFDIESTDCFKQLFSTGSKAKLSF